MGHVFGSKGRNTPLFWLSLVSWNVFRMCVLGALGVRSRQCSISVGPFGMSVTTLTCSDPLVSSSRSD